VLFAVMAGSERALVLEMAVAVGFLLLAVIGYKKSLWLVAIAIAGHGIFDSVHHLFIVNPGVPRWWPGFCMVFDVIFGGLLALRLWRHGVDDSLRRGKAALSSWTTRIPGNPTGGRASG
jgi:hypothetical protein